ncbi:HotDog domain-containing protein [Parachaetomium inaequale]|uniref:HotDog domain-containing protein n=1 Tax=Parachaetomium inaequale TaxID=2588326 RepID=A0AAN6SQE8_9PEZI|nr:HotDog domain-containing protein [Parachaetomium inaequale]
MSESQRKADFSYLELKAEDRVRELLRAFAANVLIPGEQEWSQTLFPHLSVHSVAPDAPNPSATFSFTVQPQHCNFFHILHGGCTASLFDFCTSTVLGMVARPGYWAYLGVSRTLNTTYMRPATVGTEVLVECEIVQIGQRMCSLRGTLRRASDGALLATCEHGKVNTDPPVASKL